MDKNCFGFTWPWPQLSQRDAQPHPVKEEVIDLEEDEIQVTSISQPVVMKMLSNNVKYLEQLHALLKQ